MFPRSTRPGLISQQPSPARHQNPSSPNTAPDAIPTESQAPPSTPSPKKQSRQYGYYENTKWYCNCEPRARAVIRRTKKDGINQGRCFWKCREFKDGCEFFLWLDEAEELQETFAANGEPNQPSTKKRNQESIRKYLEIRPANDCSPQQPQTPTRRPPRDAEARAILIPGDNVSEPEWDDDEEEQLPARPSTPPPRVTLPAMPTTPVNRTTHVLTTPHSKRRRDESPDADDYLSDLSSDEERQLAALADSVTRQSDMPPPPRPSSPTPVRTRTVAGLPTPPTNHKSANPSATKGSLGAKRQRVLESSPTRASSSRLQSAAYLDNLIESDDEALSARDEAEIANTMAVLQTHNSPPAVRNAVRSALNKFSARTTAAKARGKMALAAVEERNVKLQERVVALENSLREQREVRVNLRGRLLNLYQDT